MPKNRFMVGFWTDREPGSRLMMFAREHGLSKAAAVRLLMKEALDAREVRENGETRQRKGPAG
jgi:hypothetical protein